MIAPARRWSLLRPGASTSGLSSCWRGVLSIQAQTWVFEFSRSRLASRLVLLSIANHADREGRNAFPSVSTIAFEARVSERQVHRCLQDLTTIGELKVEIAASRYGTNLYTMIGMTNCQGGGDKSGRRGVTNPSKTGAKMSPEPSLIQTQVINPQMDLINWAISESERTGRSADVLLKEARQRKNV